MQSTQILKKCQVEKGFLVQLHRNLSHFQDEIKQEERNLGYFRSQEEEDISNFLGSNFDKIEILQLIFLIPNKIFAISIIILTKQLKELKSSFISPYTSILMYFLISSFRFKDILPPDKLSFGLIKIIIINSSNRKHVSIFWVNFS